MTQSPQLFDRKARLLKRTRAARLAAADPSALYLHREAAQGLAERLSVVTRRFPDAAVLGAANGAYAEALRPLGKIDRLRQIESAPALAERIGAEIGDVEASPLALESQDLIVIGLELHAANDPVGALVQARRALRPNGLLLAALFGGATLQELRAAMAEAEIEIEGGLSPRVAPMAEIRDLGNLLQRAGLALPVADSDRLTLWHDTPLALMRDLRAMGESNALDGRRRGFLRRRVLARALEIYAERYARPDGKTRATIDIVYLTGWAPDASQPQPLKPGGAARRMAEALGTRERSAGEKAGG